MSKVQPSYFSRFFAIFSPAVLAGIAIGLGGAIYLSVDNKIIGAALFATGLFTICHYGFNLFTGKVGYILQEARQHNLAQYEIFLLLVWLGNFVGTWLVSFLLHWTRLAPHLVEQAQKIVTVKLTDTPLSIFCLSIFCGLLMYIAVDLFRRNQTLDHDFAAALGIFLCVMVFILAGFEHCVANMFYFHLSHAFSTHVGDATLSLALMTLGNSCGSLIIPLLSNFPGPRLN